MGTKKGTVAIYDLRSNKPIITKDHMYGTPIVDIKFHHSGLQGGGKDYVISADRRIVKVFASCMRPASTPFHDQPGSPETCRSGS